MNANKRESLPNVLLIFDTPDAVPTVAQVLEKIKILPVSLILEEFRPELLASEFFDLLIFELFGENRSCVAILKQLEKWSTTYGTKVPPVIVVTEDNLVEQDFRTARVNFFFTKPVSENDLIVAIKQAKSNTTG